jgi:hypothetical protein
MSCFFARKGLPCSCMATSTNNLVRHILYLHERLNYWQDSVNYWLSSIQTNEEKIRFHKRMYKNRSEYSVFNTTEAEYALSSLYNYNYYIERNEILATDLDMAERSYNEILAEIQMFEYIFSQLIAILFTKKTSA